MKRSWTRCWWEYKSPLRIVVQFLLRSRATIGKKCRKLKQTLGEAKRLLAGHEAEIERQRDEIGELKERVQRLETENWIVAQAPIVLPDDPAVNGHGYGARMVSLSVELAKTVGLRGAERTLEIVFEWLGVKQKIPHWTTIRTWLQRIGVASMKECIEQADDWIWIVDHSNQIGAEKVLVVLAMRASQLPPPGETLKHEHVRVLTVKPGTTWKREDMALVYTELAERYGAPRAVLCDGAVELREGAECLKNLRSDACVFQDFKHKAANFLKTLLGNDERFATFSTQLGRTRSAIQQTELAHLTPPSPKQTARCMNLGSILNWAAVALWVLDHPEAHAHEWGVSTERTEEKLGWLREYADVLGVWRECQQVVNKGLTFINQQGLFRGAAGQLRAKLFPDLTHDTSRQLANQLIGFVAKAQRHLKKGERLPMSTEILESSFGLYKQLERQHSKGGFTSLLAAFGALLTKTSTETVRRAFAAVSVKDVKQWVRDNLGDTLTSKRHAIYKEFKTSTKRATELAAAT